jgi:hypothetical protein
MLHPMLARRTSRHGSALALALGAACLTLLLAGGARGADGDIRTFAGGGAASGTPAVTADLRHPRRVAFLPGGDVVVVEFGQAGADPQYGDGRLRRVSASGQITAFAGTGVEGFAGDGGPATDAQFNGPTDAIVTSGGAVLVADEFNHRVRRIATDGTISTVAGNGADACQTLSGAVTDAAFRWPRALALDPLGGYFVLDEACAMVHRIAPGADGVTGTADDTVSTVAGTGATGYSGDGGPATSATFDNPRGLAGTSSSVLVADSLNRRVRRIDRSSGTVTTVAGPGVVGVGGDGGPATAAYLSIPRDVEAVPSGGFLIADSGTNRVRRVLPDGTIATIAGNGSFGVTGDGGPATSARLSEPFGVNLAPDGDLYISGAGVAGTLSTNQRVRLVSDALEEVPEPQPDPIDPEPTPPGLEPTPAPTPAPIAPVPAPASPAPPPTAPTAIATPVRLTLTARTAKRGRAPRVVRLRVGANRAQSGRRVVVQLGTRVRVRARTVVRRRNGRTVRVSARTVVRYRNVTATRVRGRAAQVRVKLGRPGIYYVRLSYRDAGRARVSPRVTLIARSRGR